MASKADRFYFENLIAASEFSCKAADYLVECLINYNPDTLFDMLTKMHEFEHGGDGKKHEMTEALVKAFVTPVDREDLDLISHSIDDVTDCIEEVLQGLYMYSVSSVLPEAIEFSKKIVECCYAMRDVLVEFVNFKKPEKLKKLIIDLNHLEEECDSLYVADTRLLNTTFDNALDIINWRKVYTRMESCADACENVCDCVDTIVMKNS